MKTTRLVVLGDGGTGKTSLTVRLCLNYFSACCSLDTAGAPSILTSISPPQSRCFLLHLVPSPRLLTRSRSRPDLRPDHRRVPLPGRRRWLEVR